MITKECIDRIMDAAIIEEVIDPYVPLKKRGASLLGNCPFHNEKTPSFTVTPAKGMYKCFGCGKAGNAVTFLMEHKDMNYPEALRTLAEKYNIPVEETIDNTLNEEQRKAADDYATIMRGTVGHYIKQLHANTKLLQKIIQERDLKIDTIIDFKLGYAPNSDKFLTKNIIEKGYFTPAEKLGIVRSNDGKNYDFFRNRLMFPILNRMGLPIGLGGRELDNSKKNSAKYLNSQDLKGFFEKGKILYGLSQAVPAIKKNGFAILTEGYFDVISFHDKDANNTVGSMGTALTDEQVKLLARYTDAIMIARDGDAAGQTAAEKDVVKLIEAGFEEVTYLPMHIGTDPDSLIREMLQLSWSEAVEFFTKLEPKNTPKVEGFTLSGTILPYLALGWDTYNDRPGKENALDLYIAKFHVDALHWLFSRWIKPEMSAAKKGEVMDNIASLLGHIKRDSTRSEYVAWCDKRYGLKIKLKTSKKKDDEIDISEKEINQKLAQHKWLTQEKRDDAFLKHGFTTCEEPKNFGFWFASSGFNLDRLTNFIITPLFSINETDEKFELVEITNKLGSKIVEVPAGGFTSMDKFEQLIWSARGVVMGKFSKTELRQLNARYIFEFKQATLVRTLGMQPEGFWSWADALFIKNKLEHYDTRGTATIEDKTYYSPGAADHNKGSRKDEMGVEVKDGDPYRNDKYLSYKVPPVTFEQWSQKMNVVYKEKAMNAISFIFVSIFKDIIASFEKVPLLYGYGNAESGKSAWAERIFYFFFDRELKPYNLNSGTVFSFFNTMERFKNCAYVFNEFDEDKILEEFFRAFKQAFDGEGRNKGIGQKNKSTEQSINIAIVLIGQILTTKDGGSVLTRCVPEKFINRTYTTEEKNHFDELLSWEKKGLSGLITELLPHRAEFRKSFFPEFNAVLSTMKADIIKQGFPFKERIVRNHAIMLTCSKIMGQYFKLGFEYKDYYEYSLASVTNLTLLVNESDNLGVFWKAIQYLIETNKIHEGWDYKFEEGAKSVTVNKNTGTRKEPVEITFEKPTKLLCIRLTQTFPLFQEHQRQTSGAKTVNEKTLVTYFEGHPAFIGNNPGKKFSKGAASDTKVTSSYVFNYDLLEMDLEKSNTKEEIQAKGKEKAATAVQTTLEGNFDEAPPF